MTRQELLSKLESLHAQMEHMEKMFEERMKNEKNIMLGEMEKTTQRMEMKIQSVESAYLEKNKALTDSKHGRVQLAIAR